MFVLTVLKCKWPTMFVGKPTKLMEITYHGCETHSEFISLSYYHGRGDDTLSIEM